MDIMVGYINMLASLVNLEVINFILYRIYIKPCRHSVTLCSHPLVEITHVS
jgi:hypothetical protein